MKTKNIFKLTAVIALFAFALGCQEEPTNFDKADCGGCEIPPGGGGTIDPDPCTANGADLQAYSLIVWSAGSNDIDWTFTIKNVGTATANLSWNNPVSYQIYFSTDGVTRSVPACGSSFGEPILAGKYGASRLHCTTKVNPHDYHWVIIDLEFDRTVECNGSNNTLVRNLAF
jgi:hypothetical protein